MGFSVVKRGANIKFLKDPVILDLSLESSYQCYRVIRGICGSPRAKEDT